MIKNDFRYIIKKILIGIGIILGISFIRSCNVYALDDKWYKLGSNSSQFSGQCINNNQQIDYVIDGKLYRLRNTSGTIYLNDTYITNLTSCPGYIIGKDTSDKVVAYFRVSGDNYNYYFTTFYTNWGSNPNFTEFPIRINNLAQGPTAKKLVYNNGVLESNTSINCPNTIIHNSQSSVCFNNQDFYVYGTNLLKFFYNSSFNSKFYYSNYGNPVITPNDPEIISLNPVLNKTDDNMLVSVSFSPEFSFIDTENYNYYAWFDGEQKLLLTENNVSINTQKNTTFYVEITDKQGNSIDTETYTVSSIGLVYNGDYDIQFKIDEYSQSDTENNTDEIFDTINRIDIDILYIPKWVNYKYQYQYVPQNSSLTDDWVLVNDNNDKNNVVYTASLNGTMYARILDENDNVLKSETFTITRIGAIKTFDKNKDKFYGMFNTIKEDINFGGPISDLIVIPVNVIQSIINASNKVCTPYDLGSLWGHHIVLPCIEPEHYFGSALWTTIDLIFSGCMFYAISKWFTSAYYKFILLENTPGIKEVPL